MVSFSTVNWMLYRVGVLVELANVRCGKGTASVIYVMLPELGWFGKGC